VFACLSSEVSVRRKFVLLFAACAVVAVSTLVWPADAGAQRRGTPAPRSGTAVPRPPHSYYRPYYRPYYSYRPYYWPYYWGGYTPFYGSFYWQYPYPYPYPYYGYHYDDRAEIRVQVTPRDAQVYVDGYFAGLVDDFDGWSQRLRVEAGEHDIEIYLEGYRTRRERMLLRPHQGYRMQFALEPLPAGAPAEPRPGTSTTAPPRGVTRERTPVEREATGTLALRVQPGDAVVWIDGERWEWPQGEDRLVIDLSEGTHRVEVQRDGHRPYSTTVTIRRGETLPLNVSLPRGERM
jgi:hypothetical protein